MNNIVSALVIAVAFLFIFNIYVLYKFYMIENKLEKLNNEVIVYKDTAISIVRQISELIVSFSAIKKKG